MQVKHNRRRYVTYLGGRQPNSLKS